jgi:NitT/TauT family transport system permease protein
VGPRDRIVDYRRATGPSGWQTGASLGLGALAWEALARADVRFPFPALSTVAGTALDLATDGALFTALGASLVSLACGFVAALVLGVGLGMAIGRSRTVEHLVDVYLDAVMSAPTLIYVPVFFALFGVSRASQVAVVFAYAFFVIVETTATGARATDQRLIDMARAFGASRRQVFRSVVLPAAAPFVLTGISLGVTRAVKGMVVGEMVIALTGLGAMLRTRGARFDLEGVLALLLVIVVVSVLCNAAVDATGRRLLRRVRLP